MKYWRGYLTAAIFAAMTWALVLFAKTHTALVDMVYPYVTRLIQTFLAGWSGGVDFCLWQVFLVLLGIIAVASVVLIIVLRLNPIQIIGWFTAVASVLFFLNTGLFALNYHAGPLAEDIRLELADVTVSQLVDAASHYREEAEKLADAVPRDAQGNVDFSDFDTLAQEAAAGFEKLTYEEAISIFAGSTVPVKKLSGSASFTAKGVAGMTVALTGEAAVNPEIPAISMPFIMCREMSKRMSIADDQDANFAGFLAARANPSVQFQYSAYFMAFHHCYNALAADSTSAAKQAMLTLRGGMSDRLNADMERYDAFWADAISPGAAAREESMKNLYLSLNGVKVEEETTAQVTELFVSLYVQEVVVPMHKVEEIVFDPYDENMVDFSLPPETVPQESTEATE